MIWMLFSLKVVGITWLRPSVLIWLISPFILLTLQGEKIPRKAGQGMIKSDLFLINKTDLAPYVGANLDRMREDTLHFRNEDSFIFTNLNNDDNVKEVEEWIRKNFLLEDL